jgi:peptidoglycan/LPS O-acetylase OafA/YrhL
VVYHFCPRDGIDASWLRWSIGRGYLWVDLFFVLSGYLMALNYGGLFANGFSGLSFARFLLRRLARIYPLYAVLLGAQIAYTLAVNGHFHQSDSWAAVALPDPARDIAANFLLVQSLGISPSVINQAWSISTEFAAYLCFPVFAGVVLSGARRALVATAILAVLLLATAAVTIAHDGVYHSGSLDAYDGTHFAPLLRCLGGFLLGMLAFRFGSSPLLTRLIARDAVGSLILFAVAVALAVGAPDLVVVGLFPAVVLCLAKNLGAPAAIFSNSAIYALGLWSYAIYLLHPLLQRPRDMAGGFLLSHLPSSLAEIMASLGVVVLLLIISRAAYHGIEVPGRRAVQKVASGMIRL